MLCNQALCGQAHYTLCNTHDTSVEPWGRFVCPAPLHHMGCRAQLQDLDVPGVAQVTAQGLNLHVYSHGDFISSSLLRSQNWETHVITQLQWAINQYKPDTVSGCGTGNAQVHCRSQGNADCAS